MKRYVIIAIIFIGGAVAGFIGGAAFAAKSYAWFWEMWYDTGVGESVQRMHAAAHARLGETEEAVTILDRGTANQIHGLIMRPEATPPFASRTYGPKQDLGLRVVRTYMETFPEQFEYVLAQPQLDQWPAMTIEEIEEACERNGAVLDALCDVLLRLNQIRNADAAPEDGAS